MEKQNSIKFLKTVLVLFLVCLVADYLIYGSLNLTGNIGITIVSLGITLAIYLLIYFGQKSSQKEK